MKRPTSDKPPLHFIHIPKTAGTAVKSTLRGHELEGAYELLWGGHRTRLAQIPEGEKVFFALRDPVTRFESAFSSRQRQGLPRYHFPWLPFEEEVFTRFADADELARSLDSSNDADRALARGAMKKIRHFRRYRNWLGTPDEFRARRGDVLIALRQESLTEDFARLCAELGIEASLPTDEKQSHRSPAGAHGGLSDRGRANLKNWYAEDYEFLAMFD